MTAALFVVALFLFIKTQHYILITATAEIEAIIHNLRLRLMEHVRRSELLAVEAHRPRRNRRRHHPRHGALTQATNTLAFSAQGAVLIFFVAIYVLYLSPLAFVLSVAIVGVAAMLFQAKSRHLAAGDARSAGMGKPPVRQAAGHPGRLQGSAAQHARAATTCFTTSWKCRAPPPTSRSAPRAKTFCAWFSCRARSTHCSGPSCSRFRS